jgi:hypothetical protein
MQPTSAEGTREGPPVGLKTGPGFEENGLYLFVCASSDLEPSEDFRLTWNPRCSDQPSARCCAAVRRACEEVS